MWDVQLFELNYDDAESKAVQEVLDSGWITMGPKTAEFEQEFGRLLGDGSCCAVSNGTAALHMALLALDIGPGDEVIVPALNFIAGANCIRLVGAKPILVDSESLNNWNLSIEDVRAKISSKTAAVMCVHYAGYPCRMDELLAVCEEHQIPLIEDVAHAPGGKFADRHLGTIGDVGCFSFFTNKNLSVGEGGMVVSRREDLSSRLRLLRSHGMSTLTLDRHRGRALSYDVLQPGLNYRIDEMRAALGLVQLSKLAGANDRRKDLVELYNSILADVAEIAIPFIGYDPGLNTYHIYPVLLRDGICRNTVVESLKERRIQASIHYPALSGFTAYSDINADSTPIANSISQRELTLPLFPTMTEKQVELVCAALTESIKNAH
jgi:dTDP-4-amino-4,6-dideoxygalactose transaminase